MCSRASGANALPFANQAITGFCGWNTLIDNSEFTLNGERNLIEVTQKPESRYPHSAIIQLSIYRAPYVPSS